MEDDDTCSQDIGGKRTAKITKRQEEEDDTRSQDDRRKKCMEITARQEEENYEDHKTAGRR